MKEVQITLEMTKYVLKGLGNLKKDYKRYTAADVVVLIVLLERMR